MDLDKSEAFNKEADVSTLNLAEDVFLVGKKAITPLRLQLLAPV